jgi:hypothetical protein
MSRVIRAGVILIGLLFVAGCGGSGSSPNPADYKIEIFNGWPQIKKEEKVGGYVENAWRDPESPIIAVDTRAAGDEAGSPMANADLARVQTSELPGFKERGVKRVKLGRRPAVQWAYDTADERAGIDFFFEECGISFVVRGTMGQVAFEALSESIREMAETIKVNGCDE